MFDPLFLRCAHCGDRIGVYEPLWLESGGSLVPSSWHALGDAPTGGEAGLRVMHEACADLSRTSLRR